MNQPTPPTTEAMQSLWNRVMLLTRTRGAYQVAFPMPGTSYPMPQAGTTLHDMLFIATSSDEEFETHLVAVREDMLAWRERVRERGRVPHSPVSLKGLDLSKVSFKL